MAFRVILFLTFISVTVYSQTKTVVSPNQKIKVDLVNSGNPDHSGWYFKVNYFNNGKTFNVLERIDLGLSRNDQDFSNNLTLRKTGIPQL